MLLTIGLKKINLNHIKIVLKDVIKKGEYISCLKVNIMSYKKIINYKEQQIDSKGADFLFVIKMSHYSNGYSILCNSKFFIDIKYSYVVYRK